MAWSSSILLERGTLDLMISHAESTPVECCGFLLGHHLDLRRVSKVLPTKNSASNDQHRRFEIDPLDYLNAELYAERNQVELLGVYHSHPNHPAIPSETDRLAAQPNFSYIIISIVDQKFETIKSWRLDHTNKFIEEQIQYS